MQALGVAVPKRPRIPPNIGFGMARKGQQREEEARQTEAAVNGSRLAKKKKKVDAKGDSGRTGRGVVWGAAAGNTFRGGMLHLGSPRGEGAPASSMGLAALRPGGGRGGGPGGGRGGGRGGRRPSRGRGGAQRGRR